MHTQYLQNFNTFKQTFKETKRSCKYNNKQIFHHRLAFHLQDYSVREWKKQGAPAQKIMVGMPMYGRSFSLQNTSMFDIGAGVMGGGIAGRYTKEEGFMAYYEVRRRCNLCT